MGLLETGIISLVAVVIVLGIMILVHEWGHFMAAKFFGVRVEIFSLGFGPRVWGRKRGPTDYRVSALPLGGYVKMAGDNPSEERAGAPDEFLSKPRWQRAVIAVAGPAMNIVMAIALIGAVFVTVGIPFPAYLARPAQVAGMPKDSSAARAALQPGDLIIQINEVKNPTWEQAQEQVAKLSPGSDLMMLLERRGELVTLTLRVADPNDISGVLGYPPMPAVVEQVSPGMPAEQAGLKRDDEVVALNGQPVLSWSQFSEAIRNSGGQPLELLVRRGDQRVRLRLRAIQVHNARKELVWQIGMMPRFEVSYRRVGFGAAVEQAFLTNVAYTRQLVAILGQLFTGKVSLKQLQGVVGIARESGMAARRGPLDLIHLMAVISLNLGILNLLPIPILDGGHILMLTVEGALGRDLSVKIKERFVQMGLVFLLVIFAIVMYNDVVKLLPNR